MRRLLDVFATALTSLGEHKLRTALTTEHFKPPQRTSEQLSLF